MYTHPCHKFSSSGPSPKNREDGLLDLLAAHRWVLIGCPSASNPLSSLWGRSPMPSAAKKSFTACQETPSVRRSALVIRLDFRALSKHSHEGCNHAPRPGELFAGSTTTADPSTCDSRNRAARASRFPHPIQVRRGPRAEPSVCVTSLRTKSNTSPAHPSNPSVSDWSRSWVRGRGAQACP